MGKRDNSEKRCGSRDYYGAVKRFLRQYGKAAAENRVDATHLEQLAELQAFLDDQTRVVVHELRVKGFSWAEIGKGLGIDKSTAFRRYGEAPDGSPRKRGGQPAHMR